MGNAHSTAARSRDQATKFPLWHHASSGQWCKSICGVRHYFGPDKDEALARYVREKDDRRLGRKPLAYEAGSLLVLADGCNIFLDAKNSLLKSGSISARHFADLTKNCEILLKHFGRKRPIAHLVPDDFGSLRAKYAKTNGAHSLRRRIAGTKQLLKWLYENGHLEQPVRLGSQFMSPSSKEMRLAKKATGNRMVPPEQLRQVLGAAGPHVKAFVLLGLNAGLGNADIARMTESNIDGHWLNYPRHKTGIDRRAYLWPETLDAIVEARKKQPRAKSSDASSLVFLTRCGQPWGHESSRSPLSAEYRKLLTTLGLYQKGRSFYGLRHIFRTVADSALDQVATNFIMGHADASMAATYRAYIADERVQRVCEHVRGWLFEGGAK